MRTASTRGAAGGGRARERRRGALRRLAAVGACGALLCAAPGAAAAADGPRTWWVGPGGSIQEAVDRAASGDTVEIAAGTYREAVCVVGKGLTIRGAGREATTITWPDWGAGAPLPEVAPTPCWEAQERADEEDDGTTLADDVSGLFFLGPDAPVRVQDLGTLNHPANGVAVWGGWGVEVRGTRGVAHERYGVLAADSHDVVVADNLELGWDRGAPWYSGTAGVSVGDSDGARAGVLGNTVVGYNLGVFVKESRGGTVAGNTLTGNCAGVLLFDDSATEVPDTTRHVEGGDWAVVDNTVTANNRYCLVGRDGTQRVSGTGVAVTNADHVLVARNTITDHRPWTPEGAEPVNFPSGAVALVAFAAPPGTDPAGAVPPGTVEDVLVTGNTTAGNVPQDVWVTHAVPGSPLQDPGARVVVESSGCTVASLAERCG
ncbi:right-handed parallel beta-helix repeat-containing protein [Kineococcus sp. SYSU DK005]|uniref:right-handed parallel beta-helix repeat-containing protein n=1 Tax=Kineococcus sp. SYSU DK005 TaxID=3383126 RepID=UPI003D7CE3D3